MDTSFSDILKSASSRSEKAKMIAETIRAAKEYAWVGIYEVTEKEVKIVSCAGRSEPAIPYFPKDRGLNGRAVASGKTVVVNDIEKDEDYLLTFRNTKSEIVVPVLHASGSVAGTIDVEGEVKNAFGDDDIVFLEGCAKKIIGLWSES